ncbi:MAG TPA: hypothetical protein VHW01_04510, partial [Polyangiaceae bacterium]|nr:hypothetical protein [Polyangiaceae bacterium]
LCLEPEPFQKRDWLLLGVVPIAATVFKLTGAGIGVGLLLAVLMERRFHALGIVVLAGVLSLLTIPIFDATLGQFSAYAIHLQASHPIDWEHIALVPRSAAGTIFGVALLTVFVSSLARPSSANCRAARRVLALTACFGAVSLAAFLKHGGRENSLLPLAIGGIAALSTVLAESSASASNALPLVAVFWAALAMSWPSPPIHGETRAALVHAHEREVSFLRDSFARGQRPWSQGTAAWIDAGRRDVPLDRLASASELDLGHFRELGACERRLTNGYYDAFFLSARALSDNPFLRRIRARLESRYHVVETQFGNTNDGYAILARGPQNSEPPPR